MEENEMLVEGGGLKFRKDQFAKSESSGSKSSAFYKNLVRTEVKKARVPRSNGDSKKSKFLDNWNILFFSHKE